MSEHVASMNSPAVAVAAVPYLLTFTPQNSLVMLWIKPDGSLLVTQRIDLPEDLTEDTMAMWRDGAYSHQGRAMSGSMIAIFVPAASTPVPSMITACLDGFEEGFVRHVLVTDFTTWRFASETISHPITAEDVAAAAQLMGKTPAVRPAANREAVVAEFTHADPIDDAVIDAAIQRANAHTTAGEVMEHHGGVLATAGLALLTGGTLNDDQIADLLVSWDNLGVRDAFIALLTNEQVTASVGDFVAVVRRAPRQFTAAAATITGIYAWTRGDGLRANVALDAALEATPGYVLAELIAAAVTAGMTPTFIIDAINDLQRA